MKSLPTQERAIRKRVALLVAAREEFATSGFEVATAKSIASQAGVATGTFYQYFENKNDILRVIAENRFTELHEQIAFVRDGFSGNGSSVDGDAPYVDAPYVDEEETQWQEAPFEEVEALFRRVLGFLYDFHIADKGLHHVLDQRRSLDPELNAIVIRGEKLMQSLVLDFVNRFDLDNPTVVAEALFAMGEGLVHRMAFDQSQSEPSTSLDVGAAMLASFFTEPSVQKNGSKS